MADARQATLSVDGDTVIVFGEDLLSDRSARLYFGTVLGGSEIAGGWRCPRRRLPVSTLVVRINTFLERRKWTVDRSAVADEAVERDLQRRQSFERTRERAAAFRDGAFTVEMGSALDAMRKVGWREDARSLRPHQQMGLLQALTAINAANFSVPGSGKTATTLAVAATHLANETVDIVLVIGPLSCFRPWETETGIALGNRLRVRRVRGTRGRRRSTYSETRKNDLLILSYSTAAADRNDLIELCRAFRVMLVVDESHRVKRFRGGTWAPAIVDIARFARVRSILSGTPMPQSGRDLYSQLTILWPGLELTGPADGFAARVDQDFPAVLADVRPFVSRTPKAALGLPLYTVSRHRVPLAGTQAEIYDLIAGNFRRRLANASDFQDQLDSLRRGRPIRLLQAASNPDLLNSSDSYLGLPRLQSDNPSLMERLRDYRLHDRPAKVTYALGLVEQIASRGEKVVIWSNFVRNLDQISALIRERLGVPCFQVDGRVPVGDDLRDIVSDEGARSEEAEETREAIIDQFLWKQGPTVLVANPASCSESISLHHTCHNAIYVDRTYDCALYLQSIDRIHRLGLPEGVTVELHILLAEYNNRPTIDDLVEASLARKEAAMRSLLEGADLRPMDLEDSRLGAADGDAADLAALLRFLLGEP